ncbi:uracil-DNA glycosylase-like protein [Phakopsora pachyrhizi]|uniref:Uracil-DNA glycosylase-like protein n=1 Tax=Phakopsora pachyrhizi TaxID=170000 RepID=A0AAV0BNX3_PHAPC|nr:uracil-DNA glycosylase-like protein [Phakopsora pachyrhizi]KAI8458761.1 uracil-DNA glycosylase-like protein [Phakopsora pachyrhizi]CAH7685562.1 uracil-DNA glycosylase-like protein [Phakopsora pachyrhizi]CAH7687905.1 uracil-DNA glycosylase-like protein [Phakopsora pachyrhizi]
MVLDYDPRIFDLEKHPIYGIHPSWLEGIGPKLFSSKIATIFKNIQLIICEMEKEGIPPYDYKMEEEANPRPFIQIFPEREKLYNWSRMTPLNQVKVVILGLQPSPVDNRSDGLAFSQRTGTRIGGTLNNIFKELSNQYPDRFVKPKSGSLSSWASQGVLLLNIHQTVCRGYSAKQYDIGWGKFLRLALNAIDQYGGSSLKGNSDQGLVFLAWGEEAKVFIEKSPIPTSKRNHLILKSHHPEPASARLGFFNNQHFIISNKYLKTRYGVEIDWCNFDYSETQQGKIQLAGAGGRNSLIGGALEDLEETEMDIEVEEGEKMNVEVVDRANDNSKDEVNVGSDPIISTSSDSGMIICSGAEYY